MRPIRLEVEGFATFRSRTVLDFGELDLVAFVGPTGAGKSTIIDALTFALYGSVARYDDIKAVAPVIHQLSNEAKVRFDFELAGRHYAAVRVVRRRGTRARSRNATTGAATTEGRGDRAAAGASTKEARLERFAGTGLEETESEILAGNVRELDAAVLDLIGLDFSQFTRTVVLPQGDFARFLTDKPGDRQKLLRSLLDLEIYARMGSAAREAAKVAANQADALESELARQEPIDEDGLAELAAAVAALDEVAAEVAGHLDELAVIDETLGPIRDRVVEADREREVLNTVAVPDDLERSDEALSEADEAIAIATDEVASARAGRDEIQAAVSAIGDRSRLAAVLARFDRRDEADGDRFEANERLATLGEELADADAAVTAAGARLDRARAAQSAARRSADAAIWVAQLAEGEPCPVCLQTVTEIPDHPHASDAAEIDAEVAAAESAMADASALHSKLAGTIEATEARVAELTATIAALDAQLGGEDRSRLAGQRDRLIQLDEQATAASGTLRAAEERLAALAESRRKLAAVLDRWSVDFTEQRDAVSHLKPPPLERRSLTADWTTLASWATERRHQLAAEREELAGRGKELARRRADLLAALAEVVKPFGLDAEPSGLVAAVAVARSEAEGRLAAARERRADQQRLRNRIEELSADREINSALGRHLAAGGFEGWLLNEALDDIVARATGWLRQLSGGAYSLAVANREFAVVDHNNADERRDVRTLSGGETFLTSLSLALALADSIAELAPVDAPRLESMFLDEGFGTLDAATLDVVAGAIEDLASTGRMIGIVTHVRDLAERMPARFEVAKTPTGSTVELVEV
ncbi:MAG: SMC family ATPase [Acidimicrobiia bacterium]|nr:SMC family ATPase [Acidimicrobiia bacterium]